MDKEESIKLYNKRSCKWQLTVNVQVYTSLYILEIIDVRAEDM